MNTMRMTVEQVAELIRQNVKGTTLVTVDLDSDMDGKGKMRTKGNPFAGRGAVKRETLNGVIGYDYGAAVNRLADKEGKDERDAQRHPWGDMDERRLFRVHRGTGDAYLSMKVQGVRVYGFFLPDGTQIPDDAIRPFIPEKVKSSTQSDLNGEVIARDYKLANITGMRFLGMSVAIIPDHEAIEARTNEQPTREPVEG